MQYLVCPRGHTHTDVHARDGYCTLGECQGMIEGEATRIAVKYSPPPRRLVSAEPMGNAILYTYSTNKEKRPLPKFYWCLPAAVLFVILLLRVVRCLP